MNTAQDNSMPAADQQRAANNQTGRAKAALSPELGLALYEYLRDVEQRDATVELAAASAAHVLIAAHLVRRALRAGASWRAVYAVFKPFGVIDNTHDEALDLAEDLALAHVRALVEFIESSRFRRFSGGERDIVLQELQSVRAKAGESINVRIALAVAEAANIFHWYDAENDMEMARESADILAAQIAEALFDSLPEAADEFIQELRELADTCHVAS